MTTAGKSMAQDPVNHYSQWWAFLFLLLLSVITLFLPLHPSLTFKSSSPFTAAEVVGAHPNPFPEFTASCWCPPEFTFGYQRYTDSVCAAALNDLVHGRKDTAADLFMTWDSAVPLLDESRQQSLTPEDIRNLVGSGSARKAAGREGGDGRARRDDLRADISNLVGYKTPLALFLLAVFLRLPDAVRSLLSACCGGANVDNTVDAVRATISMDAASREAMREDISSVLREPSRRASLLYLLSKLCTFLVLCAEVVVVAYVLLPVTARLDNDLARINAMDRTEAVQGPPSSLNLLCTYKIRQIQNIQTWTMQCLFTKTHTAEAEPPGGGAEMGMAVLPSQSGTAAMSEEQVLLLYEALFTMVLALLVLLAVFNVVSLGTWTAKLLLGVFRPSKALRNDASMDLVLLFSIAWYNASPLVAMEIAKAAPGREDGLMRMDQRKEGR